MLTITHGTITSNTNARASGTVDTLIFPAFVQNQQHPIPTTGVTGTLTLKAAPLVVGRYDSGNILNYFDGNNNNNLSMTITSVIGPSKYAITVI